MSKEETLVIKYTRAKEFIEMVKKAAAAYGQTPEEFVHHCVVKHLELYWCPKSIVVPKDLFLKLARRAEQLNMSPQEYASMLLTKQIEKELKGS